MHRKGPEISQRRQIPSREESSVINDSFLVIEGRDWGWEMGGDEPCGGKSFALRHKMGLGMEKSCSQSSELLNFGRFGNLNLCWD